ncbi:hypothetical protein [Streptomyces sp. DHE17-7]|uniref:hypothetical protein n=1 Tax=Streptomyces sp. DHE17-7 TaxID=2759949 RepID=UPI0022EA6CEE|nr:hypothetical protein [Streptomyces sp. DHE17-7]
MIAFRRSFSGPRMVFCTNRGSPACARRVVARRWYASVIWLSIVASSPSTSPRARSGTPESCWPTSGQSIVATCAAADLVRWWAGPSSCAEA